MAVPNSDLMHLDLPSAVLDKELKSALRKLERASEVECADESQINDLVTELTEAQQHIKEIDHKWTRLYEKYRSAHIVEEKFKLANAANTSGKEALREAENQSKTMEKSRQFLSHRVAELDEREHQMERLEKDMQEAFHNLSGLEGSLRRAVGHIEDAPVPSKIPVAYTKGSATEDLVRDRFTRLRNFVKTLQDSHFELQKNHNTMSDRCKEIQFELDRQVSLASESKKTADNLRDTVQTLLDTVEALRNENHKYQVQSEKSHRTIDRLQDELQRLRHEMDEMRKDHELQMQISTSRQQSEIRAVRNSLQVVQAEAREAVRTRDTDQELIRSTILGAKEHAETVRSMEKLYADVNAENMALKSKLKNMDKMRNKNTALSADVLRLERHNASLSEERISLKRRITEIEQSQSRDACSSNSAAPKAQSHQRSDDLTGLIIEIDESDSEFSPRPRKRLHREISPDLGVITSIEQRRKTQAPSSTTGDANSDYGNVRSSANGRHGSGTGRTPSLILNEGSNHLDDRARGLHDSQLTIRNQFTPSPIDDAQQHSSTPATETRRTRSLTRSDAHARLSVRQMSPLQRSIDQLTIPSAENLETPSSRISPTQASLNAANSKARRSLGRPSSELSSLGDQPGTRLTFADIRGHISRGLPPPIFEKVQELVKGKFALMLGFRIDLDVLNSKRQIWAPRNGICLHQALSRKGTTFIDNDKSRACSECQRRGRVCIILSGDETLTVLPGGRMDTGRSEQEYWDSGYE